MARRIEAERKAAAQQQVAAPFYQGNASPQDVVNFLELKLARSRSEQKRQEYSRMIELVCNGYVCEYTVDHATGRIDLEILSTIAPDNEYAEQVRAWAKEFAQWFCATRSEEELSLALAGYAMDPQGFLEGAFSAMCDEEPEREPWELIMRAEEIGHRLESLMRTSA